MDDINNRGTQNELNLPVTIVEDQNDLLSVLVFCFETLFEWLTIEDLAALNVTCKQLQRMTTEFFKRQYNGIARIVGNGEIRYLPRTKCVQRFGSNYRNVIIEPSLERLNYMVTNHIEQVDSIAFWHGKISEAEVKIISKVVEKSKIIEFLNGHFDGEFYESVLKYCKNMKHLVLKHKLTECSKHGNTNQWQLQTYPSLQHFYYDGLKLPNDLESLFRQNPNLRSFQCGNFTINTTLDLLLSTDICLDELYLELFNFYNTEETSQHFTSINTLYERKQLKNIMISFRGKAHLNDSDWTRLKYLNGIYCEIAEDESTDAIELLNLKLLFLGPKKTILSSTKAEALSRKLTNLEELYLRISSIDQIIPFINNSPKLQTIYVYKVDKELKSIQVSSLNEQRMKLAGANKVEVFLPDHAYIQMKWNSKMINCSLIDVKRAETHVLKHPFAINALRANITDDRKYRP